MYYLRSRSHLLDTALSPTVVVVSVSVSVSEVKVKGCFVGLTVRVVVVEGHPGASLLVVRMEVEAETRSLGKRVRRLGIEDENTRERSALRSAFTQHFAPSLATAFQKGKKTRHSTLHSNLNW
jgi:D-alanine-D-alanine ligase-like ATP-grasp enzyme